jgi:hypothetical protein
MNHAGHEFADDADLAPEHESRHQIQCVSVPWRVFMGPQVAEAVNRLSLGQPKNELLNSADALITDVGQIRRGTPVPDAVIAAGVIQ